MLPVSRCNIVTHTVGHFSPTPPLSCEGGVSWDPTRLLVLSPALRGTFYRVGVCSNRRHQVKRCHAVYYLYRGCCSLTSSLSPSCPLARPLASSFALFHPVPPFPTLPSPLHTPSSYPPVYPPLTLFYPLPFSSSSVQAWPFSSLTALSMRTALTCSGTRRRLGTGRCACGVL